MARYEAAAHNETIEMLTDLRYREGEGSQGISTGDANPALIQNNVPENYSVDRLLTRL